MGEIPWVFSLVYCNAGAVKTLQELLPQRWGREQGARVLDPDVIAFAISRGSQKYICFICFCFLRFFP
jgi:hypothetical protein